MKKFQRRMHYRNLFIKRKFLKEYIRDLIMVISGELDWRLKVGKSFCFHSYILCTNFILLLACNYFYIFVYVLKIHDCLIQVPFLLCESFSKAQDVVRERNQSSFLCGSVPVICDYKASITPYFNGVKHMFQVEKNILKVD